jgi:hypothetical protein
MDKPPEDLLSEGLPNVDKNVLVDSIVMAVVYQEGSVQPEGKQTCCHLQVARP